MKLLLLATKEQVEMSDDIFQEIEYDDTDKKRYVLGHPCCGNCRFRREGITADTCNESVEQIESKDTTWNIVVDWFGICKFYQKQGF